MQAYGSIPPSSAAANTRGSRARVMALASAGLAVLALACVVVMSGHYDAESVLAQKMAAQPQMMAMPANAVPMMANGQQVQYMPVQYIQMPAAPQQLATGKGAKTAAAQPVQYVPVQYMPMPMAQAPQQPMAVMPQKAKPITRQQLRIGGRGLAPRIALDDAANATETGDAAAEEEEEEEDALPPAVTPPTPEEIAKALQRIQEREIQGQTFHDTLVDSQTGQTMHVPGVAGSAHNGVSGIGGIFGPGGFLGPDYPISDSAQPYDSVASGPACTCTSCAGSPPVCTGCSCRR